MKEYSGWLLDLYAHPRRGIVLWLAAGDGKRHRFQQDFPTVFYVGGPAPRLRELCRQLRGKPVKFKRTERVDLYEGAREVLEVKVASPCLHMGIFNEVHEGFPELAYFDADLPLPLRYAAVHGVFPLARCRLAAQSDGQITEIAALDDPWELDPSLPALRELHLRPDVDPAHTTPQSLSIEYDRFKYQVPLDPPRPLLSLLNTILRSYDPDVLISEYGDTWLLSHLEKLSEQTRVPFNPNRDTTRAPLRRKEVSFFNYGRAHHRGTQVHLFGRWHIDSKNCMTYGDYGLLGAIEQARVTGLPVQEVARRSPGAGISAMQTITALRRGVLSPYQSQRGEVSKSYVQLFKSDRGGMVFQPLRGIFPNVAILDFISMYPSVMIEYNISPETVAVDEAGAWTIPDLGIRVSPRLGLVPETLRPMRDKRVKLKRLLKQMDPDDPRRVRCQAMSKALKWLSVVAYGRLGYANSTFGRINAHEAVTHLGRMVLLRAKEIAEQHGFTILHLYVDSLFLCRADACKPEDFEVVTRAIEEETHLPLEFEGFYPWMAFLGRRGHPGVPVANRFFGFQASGEHKLRGIALRREDTPLFVAEAQMRLLEMLAREPDPARLKHLLPAAIRMIRQDLEALRQGRVPPDKLIVTQTLSRELEEYRVATPLSRAAHQMQKAGKPLRTGQRMRYLHTRSGARAWDLPDLPDPQALDPVRYQELLFRAAYEVLEPLNVTERQLREQVFGQAFQLPAEALTPALGVNEARFGGDPLSLISSSADK